MPPVVPVLPSPVVPVLASPLEPEVAAAVVVEVLVLPSPLEAIVVDAVVVPPCPLEPVVSAADDEPAVLVPGLVVDPSRLAIVVDEDSEPLTMGPSSPQASLQTTSEQSTIDEVRDRMVWPW